MPARPIVAVYESEDAILEATRAAREKGLSIFDAFTPYPVHGMDEAMGLPRSRLSIVCFVLGSFGLALAIAFQLYTSAVDWPLDIGGKTATAFPALVPVAFEVTVLFAALGTVAVLLARCRLWPGKVPKLLAERITDDRFVLVLDPPAGGAEEARRLLAEHGAVEVSEGEDAS